MITFSTEELPVEPVYHPITGQFLGTAPVGHPDPLQYIREVRVQAGVRSPRNDVEIVEDLDTHARAMRQAQNEQARRALEVPWWEAAQRSGRTLASLHAAAIFNVIPHGPFYRESRYFEGRDSGKKFGK